MRNNKLVIICHEAPSTYVLRNFYWEALNSNFSNVEYWDLSAVFYNNTVLNSPTIGVFKKPKSFEEFCELLSLNQFNQVVYIVEILAIWKNRMYFKEIRKYKCKVAKLQMYGLSQLQRSLKYKIKSQTILTSFNALKNKTLELFFRLYNWYYQYKLYDFWITSNNDCKEEYSINHIDYDLTLAHDLKNENREIDVDYIVFLDEFYPNHPDYPIVFNRSISDDKYYAELNEFFTEIETFYKCQVVISLHPKASLELINFYGRKVIAGSTKDLVKNSKFVLVHGSTSISYAIIYQKPIVIFYTDSYKENSKGAFAFLLSLSNTLKVPIMNISKPYSLPIDLRFSSESYDSIKYKYLTSKKNEGIFNDILLVNILKREFD